MGANDVTLNKSWLAGGALIVTLIGAILGYLMGSKGPVKSAVPVFGIISIDANGNCSQSGNLQPENYVPLQIAGNGNPGQDIVWYGRDASGNKASLAITFPTSSPGGGPGTPFNDANGKPLYSLTDGQDSGSPVRGADLKFSFQNVSVGGKACVSPDGSGVHVTR